MGWAFLRKKEKSYSKNTLNNPGRATSALGDQAGNNSFIFPQISKLNSTGTGKQAIINLINDAFIDRPVLERRKHFIRSKGFPKLCW